VSRKTRLSREYRRNRGECIWRFDYRGSGIKYAKTPAEAYSSAVYHDEWVKYRWTVDRHLCGKIREGMQFTIDGVLFKVDKRNYGVKYVTWEPFNIYNHFSHLPAGVVVITVPGEGEILE
jgi:hypothetical protein